MTDIPQNSTIPLATAGYWRQSRRPLASLVFICPLLILYEIGILALGTEATRNGVDVWLRTFLDWIGFGQYFLLPTLTICILLAWQHATREPWRVSGSVLYGMAVECVALSICLRLILQLQTALLQVASERGHAVASLNVSGAFAGPVMFLGAGIYEELLFRLILLTGSVWVLRRLGLEPGASIAAAVLITSFLFSAAHHVGPHGESFALFGFSFRFVAGVFFSALFVYRGFGIAAGAHAGYDILVGLLP